MIVRTQTMQDAVDVVARMKADNEKERRAYLRDGGEDDEFYDSKDVVLDSVLLALRQRLDQSKGGTRIGTKIAYDREDGNLILLYERIDADEFSSVLPVYCNPRPSPLLKMPVGELSAEQMAEVPRLKQEYEEGCERARKAFAARQVDERAKEKAFWAALLQHFHMPDDDPFVETMCTLASERGHAYGLHDVASAFEDMTPLYEIYKAEKDHNESTAD